MGPKSGRTRTGFGRTARTCAVLDSPRGEGRCSRFNRTTFRGNNKNTNNNFKNFSFGNTSVNSVFNSVFNSLFNNNDEDEHTGGNPVGKTGLHTHMGVAFRRTIFNYRGRLRVMLGSRYAAYRKANTGPNASPMAYPGYRKRNRIICARRSVFKVIHGMRAYPSYRKSNGVVGSGYASYHKAKCASSEGGVRMSMPTNVSGNRDVHVHRGNRPNAGKNPENSLLMRMGITHRPVFRERSVGVFSATPLACTRTTLNNAMHVGAISKRIRCRIGPKARASAEVHLGKGNMPSLEGGGMHNSRCIAFIIRIPAGLGRRTGRTLHGFSRTYNGHPGSGSSSSFRGPRGGGGDFVSGLGRAFRSWLWGGVGRGEFALFSFFM